VRVGHVSERLAVHPLEGGCLVSFPKPVQSRHGFSAVRIPLELFFLKMLNYRIFFLEFTFYLVTFIIYIKLKMFNYSKKGVEKLSKNNSTGL